MKQIVVAVFPDETSAFGGWAALTHLRDEHSVNLHASTVIVKGRDGRVTMRAASKREPLAILVGLVGGSLLGGLAGPATAIVGAWLGMFVGLMCDVFHIEFDSDVLEQVGALLEPGCAGVVADLDETEATHVETRLASQGGRVLRRLGGDYGWRATPPPDGSAGRELGVAS